jgi:hypothetical protein
MVRVHCGIPNSMCRIVEAPATSNMGYIPEYEQQGECIYGKIIMVLNYSLISYP